MASMSAEAVGKHLPAIVTLDDLAAMNDFDQHGHRYEMSPEGALSIMPPPDSAHAVIATRILFWLCSAGWPAEQVLQAVGIRIPGPDFDGGRIPDLTLWSTPVDGLWLPLDNLLLAVEIVSPSSRSMDQVVKVQEYAAAGIPQYWVVARDVANTVTLYRLTPNGDYETTTKLPLTWLLQSSPSDHLPAAP
jgi:Uma2 family endonuclease